MWKEEVVDLLSGISWLPEGTDRNALNTSRSNLSHRPHQIRVGNCSNLHSDLCVQNLWKVIPFTIECNFTEVGTTSQKKFTKSANVRKRSDKWCRSAFGAAVDRKLYLIYEKTECENGVKYVQDQTRFVYQESSLSELNNLCPYLQEGYNINITKQKCQNSIFPVFFGNTLKAGGTNPRCLVAVATIFHTAGA